MRKRPLPSQRGHVRLNFIAPAICVTLPVPSHSGQTVELPPTLPLPLQVSQTSWRATLRRTCVPRMACQKSMSSPYSRSEPFSGSRARLFAALVAKELAEDVAERSGAAAWLRVPAVIIDVIGKIEAAETHARLTGARACPAAWPPGRNVVGIETVLIVNLALLGIAQDVVGFLDFLEALFSGFVAGVQIRMILARQLTVRLADLVFFGTARYTKRFVIILFACGWHECWFLVINS